MYLLGLCSVVAAIGPVFSIVCGCTVCACVTMTFEWSAHIVPSIMDRLLPHQVLDEHVMISSSARYGTSMF